MWTWFSVTIKWSTSIYMLLRALFFQWSLFSNNTWMPLSLSFNLKDWDTWSWMVKDSKVVLHFVTYIFIRVWNISRGIQCMVYWVFFLGLWEVKWYEIKKKNCPPVAFVSFHCWQGLTLTCICISHFGKFQHWLW